MFGISGVHGSGKTTLAKELAKVYGFPYVESTARKLFADRSLDVNAPLELDERLTLQEFILEAAVRDYDRIEGPFVTDRTPLDFLAYMMAEVSRAGFPSTQLEDAFIAFRENCIAALNRYFEGVIILPPGLPYVPEPGRAKESAGFAEHYTTLLIGTIAQGAVRVGGHIVAREEKGLVERVISSRQCFDRVLKEHQEAANFARSVNGVH